MNAAAQLKNRYRRASGAHTKQLCHSERSEESEGEAALTLGIKLRSSVHF